MHISTLFTKEKKNQKKKILLLFFFKNHGKIRKDCYRKELFGEILFRIMLAPPLLFLGQIYVLLTVLVIR